MIKNPETKEDYISNLENILKFLKLCGCVIEDCIPEGIIILN